MKRIAFFSFFISPLLALAQQPADTAELEPVEVKAVRASATAPFAKTNLGKKDIERQNLGQDLPFLLNQTPSAVVNSDAGNGIGYTGIRIRGTDASRINVTLNGIPYNDPESQGSFFVNLPDFASSLSSIQVQRGAGTSTNGPAAFGASINLSTNEVNKTAYTELSNSYGSFNSWKNTVRAGTGLLNNHFTTDIRLSSITSDGYIDRAKSDLKAFYFSQAYLSEKTSIRFNVFSGKEQTYQAWYGVTKDDLQNNRRVNYAGMEKPGSPYENETDNYLQTHFQLFLTQRINPNMLLSNAVFLIRGKGYYEQYRAGEDYADYGMNDRVSGSTTISSSDFIRQLWLDNDYYGDVFSLQYAKEKTRLTIGGSLSRYKGKHIGEIIWASNGMDEPVHHWYRHPAQKDDASVYTKWQQTVLPSLELYADIQYRYVDYSINGFRYNPGIAFNTNYHFFNPKLGLTWMKNGWTAYGSFAVAQKEPNRDDFEASPTTQPKPEKLNDLEAGIEKKTNRYGWSANLFLMDYRDQLVLTGKINDVGAYTRTNIPKSYRAGVELQGSVFINNYVQLGGNLAYSKNKVKNFTEYLDDYDNGGQKSVFYSETDIALSPELVGGATITIQPLKQLRFDLLSKYVSEQYLDNTSNDERKLDAYYTQDLRGALSLSNKWTRELVLTAQVNNLFAKKYEPNGYTFSYYYNNHLTTENYYFPMAGRTFTIGLKLGW